jgi:dicarboxylate transporter 10
MQNETRVQSRIMNASGPGSNSMLGVIRMSFQTEGAMFMFKGWVPAWTRLQPTMILIFLMLEPLKNGVDWMRGGGSRFCEGTFDVCAGGRNEP